MGNISKSPKEFVLQAHQNLDILILFVKIQEEV
jgi:hypothetical protein